jgi:hypothetical protein
MKPAIETGDQDPAFATPTHVGGDALDQVSGSSATIST